MIDGPFVLTHLTANSKDRSRISASFPQPVLLNDSWGVLIESPVLDEMQWRYANGTVAEKPIRGEPMGVIYVEARDTLLERKN